MKLGGIYISVQAKTDKLKRDLKKARTMAERTAMRMKAAISKINFAAVGVAATAFGAVYVAGMKKAIDAASDLQEVQGKFDVVFKDHKTQAEKMAQVLVDSYAMSTREAKQYLSSVQDLLVPMGMASDKAAIMSNEVVKLAADLGSFNNLPTEQVMLDIQSALVGNFETMKKYGVVLNETVVKQKAYSLGLYSGKGLLDANTKAQVAFKLALEGSRAAIGDMARTSGSYANQVKLLKASLENLAAAVGEKLLPHVTEWVNNLNVMIKNNPVLIDQIGELTEGTLQLAATISKGIIPAWKAWMLLLDTTGVGRAINVYKAYAELQKQNAGGPIDFTHEEKKLARYTVTAATLTVERKKAVVATKEQVKALNDEAEAMADLYSEGFQAQVYSYTEQIKEQVRLTEELEQASKEAGEEAIRAAQAAKNSFQLWTEDTRSAIDQVGDAASSAAESFANGFVDAVAEADISFKDFARNFLRDIAKMIAKQMILNAIKRAGSSLFSASGNAFNTGGTVAMAQGGVVNSPTQFAFAGGTGIMGEAGPEAILPLSRGADGDLGVKSSGGASTVNYVIQAIDSKSFIDTVRRNPDAITMVMNEQMQRGNSTLNSNIRKVAQ